jgi:hypothetical protein
VNDGSCIFENVIFGCTNSEALNYNPNAFFDDNSCQFGEVEIPDTPTDPTPTDPVPTDPEDTIPPEGPEDIEPIDNSNGFIDEVIQIPSYTFSKIPLDKTLKILPLLLLGLSFLTVPFQQFLQAPARLFQLLFSWFGVGRKKTWGVVFDSMTKQALDPVVVSLKDATGKVIQTSITDMEGRYGFVAVPGLYSLEAHKADYVFPSEKLFGKNSDGVYNDLYFGGTFQVLEEGEIITKNIPLDAINFNWNEYEKNRLGFGKKKTFMEKLQKFGTVLFVIGFIVSIVAVFISPILWNYIMLSLYIVAGIFQILGLAKHAGSASIDGIPLSFGIMRVYSNTLKKEMKKVVLDNFGNYYCLVRNGEYYITLEARNSDGTYTLVYTSDPFKVRNGSIRRKIIM